MVWSIFPRSRPNFDGRRFQNEERKWTMIKMYSYRWNTNRGRIIDRSQLRYWFLTAFLTVHFYFKVLKKGILKCKKKNLRRLDAWNCLIHGISIFSRVRKLTFNCILKIQLSLQYPIIFDCLVIIFFRKVIYFQLDLLS